MEEVFDFRVPRSSYDAMWSHLEEHLGDEEAADTVCELVLQFADDRLENLIEAADEGEEVNIRLHEPKIVDLLFDVNGEPTELGAYLLDYKARSTSVPEEEPAEELPETKTTREVDPFSIPTHVRHLEIDADTAKAPESAAPGSGFRLKRETVSKGTFLTARRHWKEKDLEDFFVKNWTRIDFGLDTRLRLQGRQVRLKETTEKADLLARTDDGNWVVIELKMEPATGNHLTQLLSYLKDLHFAGTPLEKTKGILIAPGFGEKVLNVAGGHRDILLLRFLMGED